MAVSVEGHLVMYLDFPKITENLIFLSQTDQHRGAVFMAQPNNYKYRANSKCDFEESNRFKLNSSYAFPSSNQNCHVMISDVSFKSQSGLEVH